MALPILGSVLGVLGSIFFRKVTETVTGTDSSSPDVPQSGAPQPATRREPRAPRALTMPFFYAVGAVCLYHYLIYPVITYHWPHYNFPPIDANLFSILMNLGGTLGGAQ